MLAQPAQLVRMGAASNLLQLGDEKTKRATETSVVNTSNGQQPTQSRKNTDWIIPLVAGLVFAAVVGVTLAFAPITFPTIIIIGPSFVAAIIIVAINRLSKRNVENAKAEQSKLTAKLNGARIKAEIAKQQTQAATKADSSDDSDYERELFIMDGTAGDVGGPNCSLMEINRHLEEREAVPGVNQPSTELNPVQVTTTEQSEDDGSEDGDYMVIMGGMAGDMRNLPTLNRTLEAREIAQEPASKLITANPVPAPVFTAEQVEDEDSDEEIINMGGVGATMDALPMLNRALEEKKAAIPTPKAESEDRSTVRINSEVVSKPIANPVQISAPDLFDDLESPPEDSEGFMWNYALFWEYNRRHKAKKDG